MPNIVKPMTKTIHVMLEVSIEVPADAYVNNQMIERRVRELLTSTSSTSQPFPAVVAADVRVRELTERGQPEPDPAAGRRIINKPQVIRGPSAPEPAPEPERRAAPSQKPRWQIDAMDKATSEMRRAAELMVGSTLSVDMARAANELVAARNSIAVYLSLVAELNPYGDPRIAQARTRAMEILGLMQAADAEVQS